MKDESFQNNTRIKVVDGMITEANLFGKVYAVGDDECDIESLFYVMVDRHKSEGHYQDISSLHTLKCRGRIKKLDCYNRFVES